MHPLAFVPLHGLLSALIADKKGSLGLPYTVLMSFTDRLTLAEALNQAGEVIGLINQMQTGLAGRTSGRGR